MDARLDELYQRCEEQRTTQHADRHKKLVPRMVRPGMIQHRFCSVRYLNNLTKPAITSIQPPLKTDAFVIIQGPFAFFASNTLHKYLPLFYDLFAIYFHCSTVYRAVDVHVRRRLHVSRGQKMRIPATTCHMTVS
jgi:hypothetical protein